MSAGSTIRVPVTNDENYTIEVAGFVIPPGQTVYIQWDKIPEEFRPPLPSLSVDQDQAYPFTPISAGRTITLLESTTANTPGPWVHARELNKSIIITITGTKSLDIEGSADGVTALPVPVRPGITESGNYVLTELCDYVRIKPNSGAGTAAAFMMV